MFRFMLETTLVLGQSLMHQNLLHIYLMLIQVNNLGCQWGLTLVLLTFPNQILITLDHWSSISFGLDWIMF